MIYLQIIGRCGGCRASPFPFSEVFPVDTSKIIRLPFSDVPGFVGLLVAVPVMLFIAKKIPVLNKLT
jgi:hypothetical protein